MNDKELDKLFREVLKDLSVPPKADLWNGIECRLSEQKTVRPVRFGWMKYAAVFIACVGITAVVFDRMRPNREENPPKVALVAEEKTKKTMEIPSVETDRSGNRGQMIIESKKQHQKKRKKIHHLEEKTKKTAVFARSDVDGVSHSAETESENPLKPEKPILLARLEMASPVFSFPKGMKTSELPDFPQLSRSIALADAETVPAFPEREETGLVPELLNRIAAALALNENKILRISRDGEGSVNLEIAKKTAKTIK